MTKGALRRAEPLYRTALQLKPDYVDAQVNLALTLLLMGRFEEGWRQYESRWERRKHELHRGFAQPLWDGGDIGEQVMLVHAEQGFGDTLQFCRFVRVAAARWKACHIGGPATAYRVAQGAAWRRTSRCAGRCVATLRRALPAPEFTLSTGIDA